MHYGSVLDCDCWYTRSGTGGPLSQAVPCYAWEKKKEQCSVLWGLDLQFEKVTAQTQRTRSLIRILGWPEYQGWLTVTCHRNRKLLSQKSVQLPHCVSDATAHTLQHNIYYYLNFVSLTPSRNVLSTSCHIPGFKINGKESHGRLTLCDQNDNVHVAIYHPSQL